MKFKDKYTNDTERENNKIMIPDDTYALCELLDELIKQLKRNNGRSRNTMH